ncbi:hypothetical protein AYO49_00255 [Verrucomicrobiaceae bacterium SCGC AG-212-N21]|nr:hypothetical protein AYO49_00255 [Verrucomicrobiaceae bacterium SCGC AG-212-N21]
MVRHATAILFTVLTLTQAAVAHSGVENTLEVRIERERLVMAMSVTLEEILVAQGVKPAADGGYDPETLQDAAQRHRGYLASHFFVEASGERLPLQTGKVVPPALFTTPHTTTYRYEITCPARRVSEVTLRHDMLREYSYAPGLPWQVSYAVRARTSERSETRAIDMLRRDRPVVLKAGWRAVTAVSPPSVSPDPAPSLAPQGSPSWVFISLTLALGLALAGTAWGWAHRRLDRNGTSAA